MAYLSHSTPTVTFLGQITDTMVNVAGHVLFTFARRPTRHANPEDLSQRALRDIGLDRTGAFPVRFRSLPSSGALALSLLGSSQGKGH